MTASTHFPRMARFNAWVNNILYDAVAKLPSEAYRGDEGLFFGSVHATLNHLLLVDRLWTNRMKGAPNGFDDLAEEIHEDFESLQIARRAEDEDFIALIDELCRGDLERRVEYIAMIRGGRSAATLE